MIIISNMETGAAVIPLNRVAQSKFPNGQSRMTRSKLIDGGVYVEKRGAAHGDRTFAIAGRVSESQAAELQTLWYDQTKTTISIPEGFFVGYVQTLDVTGGALAMTYWPEGSMTEVHDKFQAEM